MSDHDKKKVSDKPAEKEENGQQKSDSALDEATQSKADLIKKQRQELKEQKDPNRPSKVTSLKFGRPEIVEEGGKTLVKGTTATGKGSGVEKNATKVSDTPDKQPEAPTKRADVSPKPAAIVTKPVDAGAKHGDSTPAAKPVVPKDVNAGQEIDSKPKAVDQNKVIEKAVKLGSSTMVGFYAGSEPIVDALRGTTEAERGAIREYYRKTYGKDLDAQLKETLSGTDLQRALNLLNLKDANAVKVPAGMNRDELVVANKRLHQTTEPIDPYAFAIQLNALIPTKSPAEIKVMNALYKEEYGVDFDHHLKDAGMSLDESIKQVDRVRAEGKLDGELDKAEKTKVDREKMAKIAEKLEVARKAEPAPYVDQYNPGGLREDRKPGWKVGEHPAEKLIENLSEAELAVLQEIYREKHGIDLKFVLATQVQYGEGARLVKLLDRDDANYRDIPEERRPALREKAKELYRAMAPKGTDEDKVYENLKNLTHAERQAVAKYFEELTMKGGTLKEWIEGDFKGDEEEKALNYLEYGSDNEASNIRLTLTKGDAAAAIARISTLKSQADLADFKKTYGVSLIDAINSSENLTDGAKAVLRVRAGSVGRKMTDKEWEAVLEYSLVANLERHGDNLYPRLPEKHHGDLKLFQNLMAEAPHHVRERFLKDGGEDKIETAFDGAEAEKDAMDYAKFGQFSVERAVRKQDKVLDDNAATVKALDNMQDWERTLYLKGALLQKEYERKLREEEDAFRKLSTFDQTVRVAEYALTRPEQKDISDYLTMSPADWGALHKFNEVNSAIGGHCDGDECRDWKDNAVYSGGVDAALSDLDSIPWDKSPGYKGSTWQDYKAKGGREKFIEENHIDLMSEHAQEKILEKFDKMLKSEKESDLVYGGRESLLKALEWTYDGKVPPDRWDLLKAIEHMSLEEQQQYRSNPVFRAQIDAAVRLALLNPDTYRFDERGAHYQSAMRMLNSVTKGGYPVADAIVKINKEAGDKQTIETAVIRHLEEFVNQPGVRERLTPGNPRYDAMLEWELNQALHNALEDDEYHWAEKVLKNGRLTFEEKAQFNKEEGDDKKDAYQDITALVVATDVAAVNERRRLATDRSYRERVLQDLPADQRQIVEKIIKQTAIVPDKLAKEYADAKPAEKAQILKTLSTDKEYREKELTGLSRADQKLAIRVLEFGPVLPEDSVRAYAIGAATDKEEMMATLRGLDSRPQQKEEFKEAYAAAYQIDAAGDLEAKLKGADERKAIRLLRKNPETAREMVFDAMETAADANDNSVGSQATRGLHSGAGDLGEDAVRQAVAMLARAAADGKVLSPDDPQLKKLVQLAYDYTDLFIAAKSETADFLANMALTAAAFVVPGGMSLRLLLMATGGGLLKVGIKEVIAGDASMGDFASGFMNVGLNAFVPAHLARAGQLGEKVAAQTGRSVAQKSAKYLVDGAEEKLERELRQAAADAFMSGGGTIENKVLDRIVNGVVKKGATDAETNAARAAVRQTLDREFQSIATQEFKKGFKNVLGRQALETAGASIGGGAGGMIDAAIEWDSSKSFSENWSAIVQAGLTGAKEGAKMGLVLGAGFKAGGAVLRVVSRKLSKDAGELGNLTEVAREGEFGIVRPEKAPEPKSKPVVVASDEVTRIGKSEYYADGNGIVYKKVGDTADGRINLARDEHAQIAVTEQGAAKLEKAADATVARDAAHADSTPRVGAGKSGVFETVTAVDVTGMAVSPRGSGTSGHAQASTAPREHLTVDGKPIAPGQQLVIGRAGDIRVGDGNVANLHAGIRVDANGNTYVKDLGSENGTSVNGTRLGPEHGEYLLKAGDRVHLGTHEVSWGRQLEPMHHISTGKVDVTLRVGNEVPISGGAFGDSSFLKSSQAKVGMDEKGLYIVEGAKPSSSGTWVNEKTLKPGEKVYLKSTDDVTIGIPALKVGAQRQGEWLFIMPRDVHSVPEGFRPADPVEFRKAVQDSNDYAHSHEISKPIPDGWQNAGYGQHFDEMGNFSRKDRPATVVDRQNDPILRNVIADAKKQFSHLPAKERAAALTDYVNKLMTPEDMSGRSLDAWYSNFNDLHQGKRIYLGEFIKQGKGVCSQQAVLLKVLGDELGLEVKLVRGAGDGSQLNTINHAWTEIKIPGQKGPLVYDPRGRIVEGRYEDLPGHRTGYDIDHGKPQRLHSPDIAYIPADVIIDGEAWIIDARGVQIGRNHIGTVDPRASHAKVSKNHALLRRGDDGVLYIRDGSSQGTYINGTKIPKGKDWPINPTDDVRLGSKDGPKLELQERLKPPADVAIGGRPLKINSGEDIPIGRQHGVDPLDPKNSKVSKEHAFLYRDPEGRLFIRDESSNGTWVNGKRIPKGQAWPIGPNDKVRLGSADGPELQLSWQKGPDPYRDVLPPEAVKPNSPTSPNRAVFRHQEWDVAGFDVETGDVILRQEGRGAGWGMVAKPVTDADLVRYPEVPIGNKIYRRDADGNIYSLVDFGGRKQLVQSTEYVVTPRKDVSFRKPETAVALRPEVPAAPPRSADAEHGRVDSAPNRSDVRRPGSQTMVGKIHDVGGRLNEVVHELRLNRHTIDGELKKYSERKGDMVQYGVYKTMSETLRDMKASGKIAPEWELFPSHPKLSPGDQIGADFVLVNTKTGEFHVPDATTRIKDNVPKIREKGIIHANKDWFDRSMGSLKVDDPVVGPAARRFKSDLEKKLLELTKEPLPFRLQDAPFPSINRTSPAEAKGQIDAFEAWLRKESLNPENPRREEFQQWSKILKGGAVEYHNISAKEQPSSHLEARTGKAFEKAIIARVRKELKLPIPAQDLSVVNRGVRIFDDGHIKLHTERGEVFDGGNIKDVFQSTRKVLMNDDALREALGQSLLKELQVKFNRNEKETLERVKNILNEMRFDPPLYEDFLGRMRSQSSDHLLGRGKPARVEQVKSFETPPVPKAVKDDFKAYWTQELQMSGLPIDADFARGAIDDLLERQSTNKTWTRAQMKWLESLRELRDDQLIATVQKMLDEK